MGRPEKHLRDYYVSALCGGARFAIRVFWRLYITMATGSGQLHYHGKHRYLSTAELRAEHNYYKILFSHINYYLQLVNVELLSQ